MVINFDQQLKDIDDNNIMDGEKPLTLKRIAINALMAEFQDEKPSGEDKLSRYVLSCKLKSGGDCDLKSEDITLIKGRIGKAYGALIVGQSWQMLEGK